MKRILGLDLGTNSIGWGLIEYDFKKREGRIIDANSRILPMDKAALGDYEKGITISATAERTSLRLVRRLNERQKLRRDRLVKALKDIKLVHTDFEINAMHSIAYRKTDSGKIEFKFKTAHSKLLSHIRKNHPDLKNIPFDWTIYHLRVKALKEKLSKEELAWVILNFNQKRGYYQLRGDDSTDTVDNKLFVSERVNRITDTTELYKGKKILSIELENGVIGNYISDYIPDWVGEIKEFIATERKLKNGEIRISLNVPKEEDWTFRKKKTEHDLEHQTVAEKILKALAKDPMCKIRGKEIHTVDRKFYKDELTQILQTQSKFHNELVDENFKQEMINSLYKSNIQRRNTLKAFTIPKILIQDIIFYQRPLKTKKHLISKCKHEKRFYSTVDGLKSKGITAAARSNPIFQEFRIWSTIHNLKIYKKIYQNEEGRIFHNVEQTDALLSFEIKAKIFDLFNDKSELKEKDILKSIGLNSEDYRLNYEPDQIFKANETRAEFLKAFRAVNCLDEGKKLMCDAIKMNHLWHIIYSILSKEETKKALGRKLIARPNDKGKTIEFDFPAKAIEIFLNIKPFKKDYGSLSEKAMKKLLPLMRCGNYWSKEAIGDKSKIKISKIIDGEYDENIPDSLRETLLEIQDENRFQGLPSYMAEYIVYGRHSESKEKLVFTNPEELKAIRLHSLRNPVVEKVLNEAIKVVQDIWKKYGKPDRIHVEIGRDLKNPKDKRKKLSKKRNENRKRNTRARLMLLELKNDPKLKDQINPYSIGQLEMFKLCEEGALRNSDEIKDDILEIALKDEPTKNELEKYKDWLEQRYISPYTGEVISLSNLYTPAYEIEHIIPRSRHFNDSFNNKVICEAEVNKDKGRLTAMEYIDKHGGKSIKLSNGKIVNIFRQEEYVSHVNSVFKHNKAKVRNLLSYDVPDGFIDRQINDTRYISKKILSLLDPVVREKDEIAARSKNLQVSVGALTNQLKQDWGLHDIWKRLVLPRFERLNSIEETYQYVQKGNNGKLHFYQPKDGIKRIDHRHHALDALVVACITRTHIQYISSLNNENLRYELMSKLIIKKKGRKRDDFIKPWQGFTEEVYDQLKDTLVSIKSNKRIINKTINRYQTRDDEGKIQIKKQIKNENHWSIRRAIHKDTVFGKIEVRAYKSMTLANALKKPAKIADKVLRNKIKKLFRTFDHDLKKVKKHLKENPLLDANDNKIEKVQMYYTTVKAATRGSNFVDESFTYKIINKVVNAQIRNILKNHLDTYDGDPKIAFSAEGLETMNKELSIPIKKLRLYEDLGKKFPLAEDGVNAKKFVISADGANLFFVIYRKIENGEHLVDQNSSLVIGDVIQQVKTGQPLAAHKDGYKWFTLSPGDLVYAPTIDEQILNVSNEDLKSERIYRMVNCSKHTLYFLPVNYASEIVKGEIGKSIDKSEWTLERDVMIKKKCIKLKMDRLGHYEIDK